MRRLSAIIGIIAVSTVLAEGVRVIGQARGQGLPPSPPAGRGGPPAQPPTPPVTTGVILGQVVDGKDSRPVGGAIVSLSGGNLPTITMVNGRQMAGPSASPSSPRRVLTDGQGRFMFYNLTASSYTVTATAPGYLGGSYGQTTPSGPSRQLTLKEDQKIGDIKVSIWKNATVSGTVVDEVGEPAVGVPVTVMRRMATGLGVRFGGGPQTRTDDRGMYRIAGLAPGDYVVSIRSSTATMPSSVIDTFQSLSAGRGNNPASQALSQRLSASGAPGPSQTGVRVGDVYFQENFQQRGASGPPPADDGRIFVYPTMYFPAAAKVSDASVLSLGAGDEPSNVDFQLRLSQTFKVSGAVISADGAAANLGVRLFPSNMDAFQSDNSLDVASTATEADGKFTFLGVPPGSYVVKVLSIPRPVGMNGPQPPGTTQSPTPSTDPTLFAEASISVGDVDVTDVSLALKVGPRVSGRVEFDGSAQKPVLGAMPQRVNVNLTPADGRSVNGPILPPVINASGQFTTMSLPPGKYLLTANAPGWVLKSAISGGRDISQIPVDLQDTDASGIVVTFFDRPAQLSGIVHTSGGDIDATAMVLIFPADYRQEIESGISPRRLRSVRAGSDGRYTTSGMLPGEYYVAAVTENSMDASDITRMLNAVAGLATRVTLAESEKHTQDLTSRQVQVR